MKALACVLAVLGLTVGCAGGHGSADAGGDGSAEGVEDRLIVPSAPWRTDFSRRSVPLYEFRRGGPGKDGIPALVDPAFVTGEAAAEWLAPREPVIEVVLGSEAKAYPIQILVWHEIVNDTVGGTPVVVSYCPLCNSALAFDRRVESRPLEFGVTGNLRNSALVLYDRETESWWQQFTGEALVGNLTGTTLARVPAAVVPFARFASRHPEGAVLSRDTGYDRPYGARPYTDYDRPGTPTLFGTINQADARLPLKERVVYLERDRDSVAIPFSALEEEGRIDVEVGGEQLVAEWLPDVYSPFGQLDGGARVVGSAIVTSAETGEAAPYDIPFWFAVAAFDPDVRVVRASRSAVTG